MDMLYKIKLALGITKTAKFLSKEAEYKLYELVLDSVERGDLDKGIWAASFAKAGGETKKAEALYIDLMVDRIKDAIAANEEIAENFPIGSSAIDETINPRKDKTINPRKKKKKLSKAEKTRRKADKARQSKKVILQTLNFQLNTLKKKLKKFEQEGKKKEAIDKIKEEIKAIRVKLKKYRA